jgi:hypothetical protein
MGGNLRPLAELYRAATLWTRHFRRDVHVVDSGSQVLVRPTLD